MRFLLDQNQSPLLVAILGVAGHDVIHVRDLGLERASDETILEAAAAERRCIISGDTDFGELLARSRGATPSVILLRRQEGRRADRIAEILLANLDQVVDEIESGAVVVIDDERVRVRSLPIGLAPDS